MASNVQKSPPLGSACGGARTPRRMPTRTAAFGVPGRPVTFRAAVRVGMAPAPDLRFIVSPARKHRTLWKTPARLRLGLGWPGGLPRPYAG